MSQEAFDHAKLDHLMKENAQLQASIQSLYGQVRARQIQAQEQFEQNAQFRTSILILEDGMRKAQMDTLSLTERLKTLEQEKAELQAKLDLHPKKEEKVKAA